MSKWKIGYLGLAAAALAASVLSAGCADERAPRSFVQPNVIKKTDLDGTWWYIQTVTEAPVTNGTAFQGQSSSLMKIKFEVQENTLYAKRAIEHVEGSEDGFWKDPKHYKGQVLAAWRVTSQFDIIRDYNSTTGEQTNRIIESTERPWNQREFVRVDWSTNLVTDYVGIGLDFFFSDGQPQVQPISYWVSDPTHPDALHIERAPADDAAEGFKAGEANYLDITNQVVLTPDLLTATYQEDGEWHSFTYPKCFFYYEQDDCASQRVKIRHAFAKVGTNHDVEPRQWDGKQMELFGVWDVGQRRMVYNRDYGVNNSNFRRHAARFNIWKQSCKTFTDPQTGEAVHPIACEPGWYRNRDGVWVKTEQDLRIPYKERELKFVPYYAEGSMPVTLDDGTVDSRYPEFLYPEFKEIIKQWNDAMKVAVKDLIGADAPHDILVPCHNPVKLDEDAKACWENLQPETNADGSVKVDSGGNKIYRVRQGDPRRSTVYWVNEQQNSGPLGYGPPLYDEETGETLSGQAYIYGGAIDSYTARSRDLMLLQNGELSQADYTAGNNVGEFIAKNFRGNKDRTADTYSPQQVGAAMKSMDFNFALAFSPENGYPALDLSSNKGLRKSMELRNKAISDGYFGQLAQTDARDNRLKRLIGKPLEKMMVTPENLAASGVVPNKSWSQLAPLERAKASPLREAMDESSVKERLKAEALGVDFATFDEVGLTMRLRKILNDPKYCPSGPTNCLLQPKAEQLRQALKKEIFLGVTLHEVGHNMGCRHNFRASYDAMNYFPDYWKVRYEAINHPDQGMNPNPDGKLHPRYLNMPGGALTQYEIDNAVREEQYSSIMDYGAEFNSDLRGLGLYDKAVIKFSYAEMLEVFTDLNPDPNANAILKIGSLHAFQNALGLPSPLDNSEAGLKAINYTDYPDLFAGGWQGMYKRTDVPRSEVSEQSIGMAGDTFVGDSMGRPLVPYYFCSDEFAGNLTCQRFDAGPDPFEQSQDIISRYQNFYLMNNWKRDRQSFHSSLAYKSRISGRYFDMLRQQLTWYVLLRTDFEEFTQANCVLNNTKPPCGTTNSFFGNEHGWGAFTLGVLNGFEMIGQTITTPTMGLFYKKTDPNGQGYWKQFRDDLFEGSGLPGNIRRVNWLEGKYIDTKWDYDGCGYYWAEECQTRIGYMIDKQVALDVLSQSQAYFTGRDTNTDVRQYAIGYIIPFKKQIQFELGSIFAGDYQAYAPLYFQKGQDFVVRQRSWAFPDPNGSPRLERIDPSTGFSVQLYAGVYGLSAFPTTFDREFIENTKIFVVGNGEATISDAELLKVATTDPKQLVGSGGAKEWLVITDVASGKMYAAHSVPAQKGEVLDTQSGGANDWITKTVDLRVDAGVRMLENLKLLGDAVIAAQALPMNDPSRAGKLAAAQLDYDKFRENVEVIRSLHNAFGYGTYKTDAPFYY